VTKKRMSDESEFIFNDDGTIKEIIPPKHLRPDIAMGVPWYEEMMDSIRQQVKEALESREEPVHLPDSVISKIAFRINEEASLMADLPNEGTGRGRPRNVGSQQAAAGAQKIAKDFNLPAAGDWEDSVTARLLTIIEQVARQEKDRMEPATGNRKSRLKQGRSWSISDWQ